MNRNLMLIMVGVIALLLGGAGGFFGGMQYQKSQTQSKGQFLNGNFQGRTGNGMMRFGNGNGNIVRGQIVVTDNNSITVKLQDGSTKIVILGSSTQIGKSTTGTISDLTKDENVTVFGTTNSDGSVTAQNIQIGNGVMFGSRPL